MRNLVGTKSRAMAVVAISTALAIGTAGLAVPASAAPEAATKVSSPKGDLSIQVTADEGRLAYSVSNDKGQLVSSSDLGLKLTGGITLGDGVEVTDEGTSQEHSETWKPIVGTSSTVLNHYNERSIKLVDDGIAFNVILRAYDDGVAVRYEVPEQEALKSLDIVDELTEFDLAGDPQAWWTKQNFDDDEAVWQQSAFSAMKSANAPVTVRYGNGTHLSIHEADLVDYSAMTLKKTDEGSLRVELVPAIGREAAVVTHTGRATPWRALTITDGAGGLIESHLLENLNPPMDTSIFGSEKQAASWVKGSTYVGIWWMLQQEMATWEEGPRHGATTARLKEYIDFAAANGIGGLLAEGWNKGWEGHWGDQDFATPTDDLDLPAVLAYAKSKGVQFIAHNETGANPWNYEKQIEGGLFAKYKEWGVHYIKTGYVGSTPNIPSKEDALSPTFDINNFTPKHHRYDQTMVNHFRFVLEQAARNQINVNCHECVHGTGEIRTFPNAVSREAVRGQEWDAFSSGNTPEHTMILPFTRMLAGPMDYTPGIMNVTANSRHPGDWRVHTTAAKQLAQAVNYFSGVQMAADLPENYKLNRGIEFYRGLPASWDETKVLKAEIGKYLVTARRSGENWFIGAMTDASARNLTYGLGFLGEGEWVAEVFSDDAATNYDSNPIPIAVNEFKVTSADSLTAALERSGGQAVRIRPATAKDADLPSLRSAELTVTGISAPATAQPGDSVAVKVAFANAGSLPVRGDITLSATGVDDSTKAAAANAGSTGTVTFQVTLKGASPVTVTAGGKTAVIQLAQTTEAPTLRMVSQGAHVIKLEWDKVEGATGYELFRRTEQGTYAAVPRARVPASVTSFSDARLQSGSYRYVLRALYGTDRSVPSNEVGGLGPVVATLSDPSGDDKGAGNYTYPKNNQFVPGAFDLTGVKVHDSGHSFTFVATIAGELTNPFGGNAISLQHLEVYLGNGRTAAAPARAGTNLTASAGWDHVVVADGRFDAAGVYDASNKKVSDVALSADPQARTISVTVPKEALPGFDPTSTPMGVAMFANSEGSEGINYIRPVYDWNDAANPGWLSDWRPGGGLGHLDDSLASKDSDTRDGNAFDIIVGEGQDQYQLLDWRNQAPVLPMVQAARP